MGSFIREKQKNRICLVTLPCARDYAHGKVTIWPAMNRKFAVCPVLAHGELTIVRRVPGKRHTANLNTWPCAKALATRRRALLLGPA